MLASPAPLSRARTKPAAAAPGHPPQHPTMISGASRRNALPMSVGLSRQQRDQARAVWAWEAYRAGNPELQDFPHLLAAHVAGKGREEEDEETPLSVAIDAVDHWNGRDNKIRALDFAERGTQTILNPAWNARGEARSDGQSRPDSDRRRPTKMPARSPSAAPPGFTMN